MPILKGTCQEDMPSFDLDKIDLIFNGTRPQISFPLPSFVPYSPLLIPFSSVVKVRASRFNPMSKFSMTHSLQTATWMAQPMHEITPTPSAQYRADLEEFERNDGRPPFALNMTELKLLGIAGVCPLSRVFF
jgi:hypothetical protein